MMICGIILVLLSILFLVVAVKTERELPGIAFILAGGVGIILIVGGHMSMPKAIDVYRGKTTLEITYKDSMVIDSVVVFK